MKKITFITGTDTGVGKTLLTAFLLFHLRQKGAQALAMKPFCSGGLGDVHLLQSLQKGELSDAEMNPFYYSKPVAPYAAAKKGKKLRLEHVLEKIAGVAEKCDRLLIEGSGGLLVPLAEGFTVANLIRQLDCKVTVVGHNRLGTINHTLLTVKHLQSVEKKKAISVVLMGKRVKDVSSGSNVEVLRHFLPGIEVSELPYLGTRVVSKRQILEKYSIVKPIFEGLTK